MLKDGIDDVYHLAAAVGVRLIAESTDPHDRGEHLSDGVAPEREFSRLQDARAVGAAIPGQQAARSMARNPSLIWREEDDMVFGPTTRSRWSYGTSKAIDEFLALAYWRGKAIADGRWAASSMSSGGGRRGPTAWSCRGWSTRRWPAVR